MVELTDADKRKILGDGYRLKQDELDLASGQDDAERAAEERITSMENGRSFIVYLGLIGLVLAAASKFSPTDSAAMIQSGIGIGVAVLAAAYFMYVRSEISKGRKKLAKA